jgi:putative tryptophan/tyrosine transport system substrate-binding protein
MKRLLVGLTALLCAGVMLVSPASAENGKLRRMAYSSVDAGNYRPQVRYRVDAFRQGLRDLGWIEYQTIAIDERWGSFDRLPKLAADLVRAKVEVIVTGSDGAARAAKQATSTIPIVMAIGVDPVALRFADSLQQPPATSGVSA